MTKHVDATNLSGERTTPWLDTTVPALANLAAADGNPLSHFQLTATTAFTPSTRAW